MLKRLGFITLFLIVGLAVFWVVTNRTQPPSQTAISFATDTDTSAFARAYEPIPFEYPKDHGPHVDFQTEWWYYTGNLQDSAGNHYGYQLTIFRRGLTPGQPSQTDLATNQIYFAHFAVTDVSGNRHLETERFSRGAGGLSGAQGDPFRVWIEDWSATGQNVAGSQVRLQARAEQMAIDLTLQAVKPIVEQGEHGLSRKSEAPGNASYYVSFTRLTTQGQLTLDEQTRSVKGESWFDHEWSTSALGQNVIGWNWFSLQLDDGREVMFYQFRMADGGVGALSAGTLVEADGSIRYLQVDDVEITVDQTWRSPTTEAEYPSRWQIVIPSAQIDLTVEPYVADQEMTLSSVYWEGAVKITGTSLGAAVNGNGYVELTGYKGSLKGTF
jgi:predicted secreted hydrolase